MKLNINKVILWLNNSKTRVLEFQPNKVNVITGDSGTGKTDIENIIYYCLLNDDVRVTESVINENVNWYGLSIEVNDKKYTICRKSFSNNTPSDVLFFSSIGEIPNTPNQTITKYDLKKILETEFSISKDTKIPFGGKTITNGSKISMNYFLLFNLIDVSIIENKDLYFPFQTIERYREAIERVFDLALGIETVENVLKTEQLAKLNNRKANLERKILQIEKSKNSFEEELSEIIRECKNYNLIDSELDYDASLTEIKKLLDDFKNIPLLSNESPKSEKLRELSNIQRKKRNLENFQKEYEHYKKVNKNKLESLKPIEFIRDNDSNIIKTSIFNEILESFETRLELIKRENINFNSIDLQLKDYAKELLEKEEQLNNEIKILPDEDKYFESEKEKIYFLGQLKNKFDLFTKDDQEDTSTYENQIKSIDSDLDKLIIYDVAEKKEASKSIVENYIRKYMNIVEGVLDNYSDYLPYIDFKKRRLELINPKTNNIEGVGSSSNHMFLQLFFTLGLHELACSNNSPYIAPFLIIDQPSRPYYGDNNSKSTINTSDSNRILKAFTLLDSYVEGLKKNNRTFQMIIFEHIPKELIMNLPNIHIVEEFINGNKLINL